MADRTEQIARPEKRVVSVSQRVKYANGIVLLVVVSSAKQLLFIACPPSIEKEWARREIRKNPEVRNQKSEVRFKQIRFEIEIAASTIQNGKLVDSVADSDYLEVTNL